MKLTHLFNDFFNSEKTGGLFLVFVTLLSLVLSNSSWQTEYINIWHGGEYNLVHWINDGLMSIFFLLIGLELEREFYIGELSDIKNASLPVFGALGGMLFPAGLFLMLNLGSDNQAGFGIPMATDIAFAIGILSLLGNKIPKSLKVFLAAFAVIDDLGAIILIAIFYTTTLSISNMLIAFRIFGLMLILNRLKVHNLIPYIIGGIFMWYFMLNSGVHPTVTGVMLAFAIPFGDGGEKSPSFILQHLLHKPVAFLILPLFALANTAMAISRDWYLGLGKTYSLGIILGLLIGKPLGIWLFSFIGVKSKLCILPSDLNWKNIFGVGILGGIGFTMSIFITLRAFDNLEHVDNSKIAILVASLFVGIIGLIFLKLTLKKPVESEESQ